MSTPSLPLPHPNTLRTRAHLSALGAIALWATLASLGVSLVQVPPFLLTGLALIIGSLPTWPQWRQWRVAPAALALGVYGLFGYHLLLFIGLRHAPPVQANLVNSGGRRLMGVLAPLVLRGVGLRAAHGVAALLGFAGAALAILGGRAVDGGFAWGYLPAFGAAVIWATYSLGTRRFAERGRAFPTAAIGLFALVSGALSLGCHALWEPPLALSLRDALLVAAMGLGPLGAAFFLWDRALKGGDPRTIGVLSYLTPLASTTLLTLVTHRPMTLTLGVAAVMIVGAALTALRAG